MKSIRSFRHCALVLATLAIFPMTALGAASPKKAAKQPAPGLKFRVQQLHVDNNEGCDVADFNKDGHLDISAGEFWYAGPKFTAKIPLRKLEVFGEDYLTNNSEHAYDVDGDGWLDIVSGSFRDTELSWYRNPGADALKRGVLWERRLLIDTKLSQNESTELHDLDRDGTPELVVSSYNEFNPFMAYKFAKDESGKPVLKPWKIQDGDVMSNGHGLGFGDLNGDGREDILYGNGWYEHPATSTATQPWKRHADWKFPQASSPMIIVDLNGDGRNDIIWGQGHNYGLSWEERQDDNKNGSTNWRRHLIDDRFSQAHALAWEDIDNDGQPELITGRRFKAHSGKDPGDAEPGCVYYFKWDRQTKKFAKYTIAENGPGIGLQIRIADLNKDGRKDIVVAGKSGTHILWNLGK